MKYNNFHPDFFLKIGNDILVVEIKKDEDDSKENIAKNRDAVAHFNLINKLQTKQRYRDLAATKGVLFSVVMLIFCNASFSAQVMGFTI